MQMSTARSVIRSLVFAAALGSVFLFGQAKPHEFPVTMRRTVLAGSTPSGTKVEAKLTLATLFEGTVIPAGATFVGEVVESAAKSATAASRLAIRMDSVRWKTGSAPIRAYLTAWYYPVRLTTNDAEAVSDAPPRPSVRNRSTVGPIPSSSQPGPSRRNGPDVPPTPSGRPSENRVTMKGVESTRHGDGVVALTSNRFNIRLNKTTTYVLATADPPPMPGPVPTPAPSPEK